MSQVNLKPALRSPGRVLVVGLGASGQAALELCLLGDADVHAYDRKTWEGPSKAGVRFFSGPEIPDAAFAGVKNVVMSPGIDPRPVRAKLRALGMDVEIQGEMGLALKTAQSYWPAIPTVLVTGTNGKSTVTHLCAHLLRARYKEVFAGGNLGIPLSQMVVQVARGQAALPDAWVLECSSYQLETLHEVRAQVAMLLNVSADHLDRYDDIEHYARTKASIFDALGSEDLALLDTADPRTPLLAPKHAPVIEVGAEQGPRWRDDGSEQGQLWMSDTCQIPRASLALPGQHNANNAIFALLAAEQLGVDLQAAGEALKTYQGLEHRMQWVAQIEGVEYFNDSKATNVASVKAGLLGFPREFVLICGGRAKQGDDPGELMQAIQKRCRALIGIGESGDTFVQAAQAVAIPAHRCERLEEAVALAATLSASGQAVILSPACASWDQFDSFGHRGKVFEAAVRSLDHSPHP